MDDLGARLTQEENGLSVFKSTVNKSSQLCEGICSRLVSLDGHLIKLERTILPVYKETEELQQKHENIGKILEDLDHVIQFYSVSKEVESIIEDGPSGSLENFLEALEKIKSAIKYFEDSDPSSEEFTKLTTLFDFGGDMLQREFQTLVTRNTKPYPVVQVLELIEMDDFKIGVAQEVKQFTAQQMPGSVKQDLTKIVRWLLTNKNVNYAERYTESRSNNLAKSMQNLKDHQKITTGNSTLSAQNTPSPQMARSRTLAKENTPTRSPKIIQQFMKRKATAIMAKYNPNVGSPVLGHGLPTARLQPDSKDQISERDVIAFMTSMSAFMKLTQCEYHLMHGIVVEPHQTKTLEMISEAALLSLRADEESIVARVKRYVSRHDFSSALYLFPILRLLTSIQPEFNNMFKDCALRNHLQVMTSTLHTTLNKALEEFVETIKKKNDSDTKMPRDGTVHELTRNVMMLLEHLLENQDILRNVLALHNESSAFAKDTPKANKSFVKDTAKIAFAQYIARVLTAMGLKLHNKSEAYDDPYLKAIFRMNNLHYILKSLQQTGLIDIIHLHYTNVDSYYNDQILTQKKIYSQSWNRVLHYVTEVDQKISQHKMATAMTQLKDKDKQNIKDKFTGFNKEMDEIYRIQKNYAIPDIELRENLKKDNKNNILRKYQMFYNKYASLPFAKNPEKYLKYSPLNVSETMDKFFDVAA